MNPVVVAQRPAVKDCTEFVDVDKLEYGIKQRKKAFYDAFQKEVNDQTNISVPMPSVSNKYVSQDKVDTLREMAVREADLAYPGGLEQLFSSAETFGNELVTQTFSTISSQLGKAADHSFKKVRQLCANVVVGKLILGDIITQILMAYSHFGRITLIVCVILRIRSISRMLNKLYVIGMKQKEIVERCFLHEESTYITPMAEVDIYTLSASQPAHKSHSNFEILGLVRMKMEHLKHGEEIDAEEQHKKQQKLLEYRFIHDIHYFLPSFVVSQMLSSIIQFWIIYLTLSVTYFSLVFWVAKAIVIIPESNSTTIGGGTQFRTFATEDDLYNGLGNLYNSVIQLLLVFLIPFLIKAVILKYYGKYLSNRKNGIRSTKKFLLINTLQMILLIPVTSFVMILRLAAVFSRAVYLLGDMDKPFGVFVSSLIISSQKKSYVK